MHATSIIIAAVALAIVSAAAGYLLACVWRKVPHPADGIKHAKAAPFYYARGIHPHSRLYTTHALFDATCISNRVRAENKQLRLKKGKTP